MRASVDVCAVLDEGVVDDTWESVQDPASCSSNKTSRRLGNEPELGISANYNQSKFIGNSNDDRSLKCWPKKRKIFALFGRNLDLFCTIVGAVNKVLT